MTKQTIFILGGARSGKSRFAQELALKLGQKVLFVATAEPRDDDMRARIEKHQKNRPRSWRTLELPTGIGKQLAAEIGDAKVVVLDCLTLLVSNLIGEETDYLAAERPVLAEIKELVTGIDALDVIFIIVSNEVGMGLVPENRLARIYRDILGNANQSVARYADVVYFMMAGIPVKIKGDRSLPEAENNDKH